MLLRTRKIRRSVAGLTLGLFTAAFLAVYVQLASGHDPALSANAERRNLSTSLVASTSSTTAANAARKATAERAAAAKKAAAEKATAETAAAEEAAAESSGPAAVTTSQS
jgi:phosphoglycerol transferase MdoB-like AlkP superfamily enzyme